jgi:hypothetical protein
MKCWFCGGEISDPQNVLHCELRGVKFSVGAGCIPDLFTSKALAILVMDILQTRRDLKA